MIFEHSELREICQEMIIRPDGSVEIPWFEPEASSLVVSIWDEVTSGAAFPVSMPMNNKIYCG